MIHQLLHHNFEKCHQSLIRMLNKFDKCDCFLNVVHNISWFSFPQQPGITEAETNIERLIEHQRRWMRMPVYDVTNILEMSCLI